MRLQVGHKKFRKEDGTTTYQVTFENEGKGVLFTWEGTVCDSELLSANEYINTHEQMQQFRYRIWDFTAAIHIEVSEEQLRTLAIQDSIAAKKIPIKSSPWWAPVSSSKGTTDVT